MCVFFYLSGDELASTWLVKLKSCIKDLILIIFKLSILELNEYSYPIKFGYKIERFYKDCAKIYISVLP